MGIHSQACSLVFEISTQPGRIGTASLAANPPVQDLPHQAGGGRPGRWPRLTTLPSRPGSAPSAPGLAPATVAEWSSTHGRDAALRGTQPADCLQPVRRHPGCPSGASRTPTSSSSPATCSGTAAAGRGDRYRAWSQSPAARDCPGVRRAGCAPTPLTWTPAGCG